VPDVTYVGPFSYHAVVVNGWRVPLLTASPLPKGGVHLTLDNRFGLDVSLDDEASIVPFVADCIAVALGYGCHPDREGEPVRLPPFRRLWGLEVEP